MEGGAPSTLDDILNDEEGGGDNDSEGGNIRVGYSDVLKEHFDEIQLYKFMLARSRLSLLTQCQMQQRSKGLQHQSIIHALCPRCSLVIH